MVKSIFSSEAKTPSVKDELVILFNGGASISIIGLITMADIPSCRGHCFYVKYNINYFTPIC